MGKPSNKGMSTPLSIPSLSAVTILMMITAGKRNYSMMASSQPPRMKEAFPHPFTLTDAASGANSIENAAQPSTGLSNESNTDATATAPTETVSDNAG